MRVLPITITQAAFKRLSLLADLDALPLPLDPEDHRPFGFDFRNGTMCLTFEGADVAYVPRKMDNNKKTFSLRVTMADDHRVDKALTRFFDTLSDHLKRVGQQMRANAEPRGETRAERTAREEKLARERLARVSAMCRRAYQQISPYLTTPGRQDAPAFPTSITREPFSADDDVWEIQKKPYVTENVYVKYKGGATIAFKPRLHPDGSFSSYENMSYGEIARGIQDEMEARGTVFNMTRIAQDLLKILARDARLDDMPALMNTLKNLPTPVHAIERAITQFPEDPHSKANTVFTVPLDDGFFLSASSRMITIKKEGCVLAKFKIEPYTQEMDNPDGVENLLKVRDMLKRGEDVAHDLAPTDMRNILGVWLSGLIAANPDMDASIYAHPDPDAVAAAFFDTDTGYRL